MRRSLLRRSLLLRLLGLALGVASLAVVATALLATYGTGNQLREELESDESLLETDSYIRGALLSYASNNDGWQGVDSLVRSLAEETGRRIALISPDGGTIADSAELLGQGSGDLPATPAALIDATVQRDPSGPGEPPSRAPSNITWQLAENTGLTYHGWQLTEQEIRKRESLIEEAEQCLRDKGFDATIQAGDGVRGSLNGLFVAATGETPVEFGELWTSDKVQSCVPKDLYAPSGVAREINEKAAELTGACLDRLGLEHQLSEDSYGMRIVHPVDGTEKTDAWRDCERTSQVSALEPYVAPPADLYLGTNDRFDVFSPAGWWRTTGTAVAILLVAAVVTVLAGRRLVRPILALTSAAQRMKDGDRTARVPVSGNDEVARLGDAFNGMAEAIESSDQQRKALVSDVAHELRTPLANVRTHLEAVEVGVAPLDASLVQSLQEESALLERLVSDLQDLALADAGMLRVHPEERDATDIAGQAVAAHRAQAESAGVVVELDAAEPVSVYADPARLRQALGNLVSNAVTHTPAGGSVQLAVRGRSDEVVVTVVDTGAGIADEHLPHIFDRFYRADRSRSRTTGGSGLGLAITKHLVEAHGGAITAASSPGHGSTFTIRLPAGPP